MLACLAVASFLPVAGAAPATTSKSAASPSAKSAAPASKGSEESRYLDLVRRKEQAKRLNALWKLEADLSSKRTAYAVLDLSDRKLYFKVRGRTFKAVSLTNLVTTRGAKALPPEELAWRAFTLQLKEGKGVETETIQRRTLSEEEKRMTGRDSAEDEPIGAEQGAVVSGPLPPDAATAAGGSSADADAQGTQKMAGVAGGAIPPDPPPKYHLGFDGDLSIWVIADAPPSPEASRYRWIIDLATSIGRTVTGSSRESGETRITVNLPLPLAQQIYRELLPGQRLLITQ